MGHEPNFADLVPHFFIECEFSQANRLPSGHINDTYAVDLRTQDGQIHRYLMQRINHHVFKHPNQLMQNVAAVTKHLRRKIAAAGGDPLRETMTIIPTVGGEDLYLTPQGDWWRAFVLIGGAQTYDMPQNLEQVYSAGRAFGDFQRLLGDFPANCLHETIPGFHDTKRRLGDFEDVLSKDLYERARRCRAEIALVHHRVELAPVLVDLLERGILPERVTHNDTKFNNVMIDDETGQGVCVIDLDTVMPGSSLFDFGDGVRSITNTAPEDVQDLSKVQFCLARFEHYCKGFLDGTRDMLTPLEVDYLPLSVQLMTFELGLRFLTDFLAGDTYFRIRRPDHNLDRCRVQFKLLQDMEAKAERMLYVVQELAG